METYEVWLEGYIATGESSEAHFYGLHKAASFKEACMKAMTIHKFSDLDKYYNEENNTYWACHFYNNELEARKSFG